jgi:hypothetical protein
MRMPTPLWNLRSAVSSLLINHAMADFLGGKPLSCEIPLEGVVSTAGKLMLKSVQARIDGRKDEGSASGYEKKTAVSSLIVNAQFSDERRQMISGVRECRGVGNTIGAGRSIRAGACPRSARSCDQ